VCCGFSFFFLRLCLNRSDTSLGISENSIALSIASASTKTNAQPDGPSATLEEKNRGDHAKAKAKTGLN
jgi:hypothetical protein